MRTKRTVSIAIICVLAITVLGAAMVYAPPPGDLTLPPLFNAFITNTEEDPVPVDLTDERRCFRLATHNTRCNRDEDY
jgi:hypothetical protein